MQKVYNSCIGQVVSSIYDSTAKKIILVALVAIAIASIFVWIGYRRTMQATSSNPQSPDPTPMNPNLKRLQQIQKEKKRLEQEFDSLITSDFSLFKEVSNQQLSAITKAQFHLLTLKQRFIEKEVSLAELRLKLEQLKSETEKALSGDLSTSSDSRADSTEDSDFKQRENAIDSQRDEAIRRLNEEQKRNQKYFEKVDREIDEAAKQNKRAYQEALKALQAQQAQFYREYGAKLKEKKVEQRFQIFRQALQPFPEFAQLFLRDSLPTVGQPHARFSNQQELRILNQLQELVKQFCLEETITQEVLKQQLSKLRSSMTST